MVRLGLGLSFEEEVVGILGEEVIRVSFFLFFYVCVRYLRFCLVSDVV